jgi:hypothetical protein
LIQDVTRACAVVRERIGDAIGDVVGAIRARRD